ncbi:hypothetical protein GE21DRAFT_9642 [Neurospora crassa]|uniref:Uncharacterized protein n=1 Tax=Neurospora crassa (strain ATCC 24698 / 74-OR23-1A / CBS 708.71 / DSM 1257 / FGSC 987) TaxID=367110 RepID=V5IKF5_NEUCR|nr:hypothetical protein NCU17154 [Neurospora crassa OR74A]ESA41797.1 hypothetical protein NCU17154 [Neurospora crassa OR74A]KHE80393.1 hypothetical protein GE21DRAFT_9642 [Neurospora crassa]|eukprot:XP_011395344.1 hypothetical protein NCU17154 [Neurospora crassa OR74A]
MANQQLPPPRRRGDHLFERWGVKLQEDSNGIISSGLLPMFPTVDGPYGLAEDLWWTHKRALQEAATHAHPMPKSIPKPSSVQLDELFCTERWQQVALHGLRTWELPSLNQGIIGTSYWQEVFMMDLSIMQLSNISVTVEQFPDIDLIHVDESKWHIAFRRSRWYDLRGVVLEKDANGRPTNTRDWSVDDNGLWGELRVAIEMANRMLHHILYGDWISAMLEGSTDPIPNVLPFSADRMPHRMVSPGEAGIGLKQPDQRIANRIWHQIELLSQWIIWSFFDPRDLDKYGSSGQPGGVTAGYCSSAQLRTVMEKPLNPRALPHPHDPEVFTDIKINTMLLEALLSISNTPEEVASKHTTRLQLALVIVHEFMHALQTARVYVMTCSGGWQYEPYYKNEVSAELGWSQEQSLLGAVRTIGPLNVFVPDSDFLSRAGPAFTIAQSWLDDPTVRQKGKELQELDGSLRGALHRVTSQMSPLPTYWCSRFQSQSFWDSHVAIYGQSALKAEPVVLTKQSITMGSHVRIYHARGHVQPSLLRHQPIVPNQMQRFRLEEEQTFQYMEFRKKLWKSLRPWYKQSYRIWQKTPYSFLRLRRLVDHFRQAVLQRNRVDAEAAVNEYSAYLKVLASEMSTPYAVPNAPPGTLPFWFFEFHRHPALWPFFMLEVMMHASLPYDWSTSVRKNAAPPSAPTATTSNVVSLPNRWFPSQHARAAGAFFKYPSFWTSLDEPPNASLARPDVTDPSDIHPPMVSGEFTKPYRSLTWPSPEKMTSLYKARWNMLLVAENKRIKEPMKKYPISKRLWQALMDQYKQLTRHNQRLGEKNNNGQWLDFDFVFPPYDENDEFVVLDRFSRPMDFGQWVIMGYNSTDWFLQGHADPDKLTVMSKAVPAPADAPEVYLPSEDEGDGDAPEVWQRWWPVHPHVDVDMDVDMMDG